MYERIHAALQEGATVVAANRRLARYLLNHYEQVQIQSGRAAWATPDIIPWTAWLEHLWEESRFAGGAATRLTLLSDQRCSLLWEELIERSGRGGMGAPAPLLARSARQAWALLQDWQLTDAEDWDGFELSGDQRAFCGWFRAYRQRLQDNQWIDSDGLSTELAGDVAAGVPVTGQALLFIGFDSWPPARAALLESLQTSGVATEHVEPGVDDAVMSVVKADSQSHEWLLAASWARAVFERNPDADIAVVLPDLAANAADVARVFRDVLVPDWRCGRALDSLPLNISYGRPLADYPLIDTLLRLLDLSETTVEFTELSLLLRSRWLTGAQTEAQQRAMLELSLRRNSRVEVQLSAVLGHSRNTAPLFAETLEVLLAAAADHDKRTAAEWVQWFSEFASQAGWPGSAAPDSESWQLLDKWQGLLRNFCDAGDQLGSLARVEAVALLKRMARMQLFQPQGPRRGIQVMGALEAAGHQFDYLWVCGMARELWPQASRPNPFIPVQLQRQAGLPDCDARQSLDYARGVTQRLRHSAGEVIFSWPAKADEQPYAVSPLVADLTEAARGDEFVTWNVAGIAAAAAASLSVDPAPAVPEGGRVSGGAQLFRSQAVSPATAFIAHRLGGSILETPPVGLSRKQRGIVVHDVLQRFYTQYASSEALQSLTEEQCRDEIAVLLLEELNKLPGSHAAFMKQLIAIEQQCLASRIWDFIHVDRQRPAFVVEECEQKHEVSVGPIRVSLKLDRLDKLPDGGQMVIDYKTGKVNRKNWNPQRPTDLQLPLYVTRLAARPAAIAFAQLSAHGAVFAGVGNGEASAAGVAEPGSRRGQVRYRRMAGDGDVIDSWEVLLAAWDEVLLRLAEDFASGDFSVDPENPNEARGQLAPLTRIYELDALADPDVEGSAV
jgi:ATP-dependent helicase/nuclease subunit B